MNKPAFALFLLLSLPPLLAPAQQLINTPTFQGQAQTDLNLGGHNLTNAGTITATALSGSLPWSSLTGIPTTLTAQGNTFNGVSQLVQTTSTGAIPFDVTLLGIVNSKVVFDGDSIFQGYGASSLATRFSTLFSTSSYATTHNLATLNVAVSGSTLQSGTGNSILDNLAGNVYPHRSTALGGDGGPNPLYIGNGGTNDIKNGRTAAQIITDLTTRYTTVHSYGMKCIVATIPPRIDSAWTTAMEPVRAAVNIAIRSRAVPSDGVWEIDNVMIDPGNNYQAISYDGLHPNDAGHVLLEHDLEKQLKYAGFQPGAGPLYFQDAPKIMDQLNLVNGGSGWFIQDEPNSQDFRIYDSTVINGSPQVAFAISGHGTGSYTAMFSQSNVTAKYFYAAPSSGIYSTLNGIRLSSADSGNTIYMATGSGNNANVSSDSGRVTLFGSGRIATAPASVAPTDNGADFQVYTTGGALGTISAGGITTPANYSSVVGGWRLNSADIWNTLTAPVATQIAVGSNNGRMFIFPSGNVALAPYSVNAADGGANLQVYATGGGAGTLSAGAISASALLIAGGTNAKAGTFTLTGGAATVANTSVTANSVVHVTVKTVGGTRAGNPDIVPKPGTGFTAAAASSDASTYNYWIEN